MSKKVKSELTKNHQATTKKRKVQGQRMYATESVLCLLSHLKSICIKDICMQELTDFSFIPKITSRIMTQCGTEPFHENYFDVSWFI